MMLIPLNLRHKAQSILMVCFCLTVELFAGYSGEMKNSSTEYKEVLICPRGSPENRLITDTATAELKLHLERFFGMKATVVDTIPEQPANGLRFIVGASPDGWEPIDSGGRFAIAIRGNTVWLWGHDRQLGIKDVWDPKNSIMGLLRTPRTSRGQGSSGWNRAFTGQILARRHIPQSVQASWSISM